MKNKVEDITLHPLWFGPVLVMMTASLIQEFYLKSGKAVRKESKKLLKTTGLVDGELKG